LKAFEEVVDRRNVQTGVELAEMPSSVTIGLKKSFLEPAIEVHENALEAQRKCVCRKEAEGARMGTAKKKDNRKS